MSLFCEIHYLARTDCGCKEPATPALPSTVFVAFCTYTYAVRTSSGSAPATQPISGGPLSIFNRPQVTTEERMGGGVVAVTRTRPEAEQAIQAHKAEIGIEATYEITEHTIGLNKLAPKSEPAVTSHPCLLCQTPGLPLNRSFCDNCEANRNAALRSRDLELINGPQS